MPDLTPFAGAIQTAIGAIIGGAVALVVATRTMDHQRRLEVLKDQQALRNATRDRLRAAFEPAFLAAAMMDAIAQRTLSLSKTQEELTARYDELRALGPELSRAGVHILLEQHGTEAEAAYNKVRDIFGTFEREYMVLSAGLTDDRMQQLNEVRQQRDALTPAVEDLRQAMLQALAPFEEPIVDFAPVRPSRRLW